ncbi:MAG: 3-oxoacyl-[acyl-carrier-protein] synthase III C-terminal domain-containing protein [Polyangiaceae bacterium]
MSHELNQSLRTTILGTGAHLPETIRTNSHWSPAVTERWMKGNSLRDAPLPASASEGMRKSVAALRETGTDPFRGALERRVLEEDKLSSDMEFLAARAALESAGISPSDVGFLLTYSMVPDFIGTTNACLLHRKLGLPTTCLTTTIEAACNAFLMQLTLADHLIRGGGYKFGLLVQSSCGSRLLPHEDPVAPQFGDGATAVVVGPSREGFGVEAWEHRADGSRHQAIVVGVPGRRWYEGGDRLRIYVPSEASAVRMLITIVDRASELIRDVAESHGARLEDIDFYACHQAAPWLRPLTQEASGLHRARSFDTFKMASSLSGANIPLVLHGAAKEGTLRRGDRVMMFGGGAGETWSALRMKWGSD